MTRSRTPYGRHSARPASAGRSGGGSEADCRGGRLKPSPLSGVGRFGKSQRTPSKPPPADASQGSMPSPVLNLGNDLQQHPATARPLPYIPPADPIRDIATGTIDILNSHNRVIHKPNVTRGSTPDRRQTTPRRCHHPGSPAHPQPANPAPRQTAQTAPSIWAQRTRGVRPRGQTSTHNRHKQRDPSRPAPTQPPTPSPAAGPPPRPRADLYPDHTDLGPDHTLRGRVGRAVPNLANTVTASTGRRVRRDNDRSREPDLGGARTPGGRPGQPYSYPLGEPAGFETDMSEHTP